MLQLSQKILGITGTAPKENFARHFLRLPAFPLEHVPEKLPGFFGFDIRHPIDFEQHSYRSKDSI
jgi:hypothetical protein